MNYKYALSVSGLFLCLANASLVAVPPATWNVTVLIDNWLTNANWTPPQAPQNAGDVAIFNDDFTVNPIICNNGLPNTITLGEVRYGKATLTTSSIRSNLFAFDSGIADTPAQINLTSGKLVIQTSAGLSTTALVSPLVVNASAGTSLFFFSSLTGSGSFTYNGVAGSSELRFGNAAISNVNASLYTINQGNVIFGNSGGPTFPGDLLLLTGSHAVLQTPGQLINQFATTSNIYLQGGELEINNTTNQAANTLTISQNGNAQGRTGPPQIFTLHNATTALAMKGGTFSIVNLVLLNGGAIAYDTSLPGEGVAILGDATYASTINLNGHTVDLNIDKGSDTCALFDMKMINEQFLNGGALVKKKAGTLLFEGTTLLPTLTIDEGRVILGSSASDSVTFANGATLQINPQGVLSGFGRIVMGSHTLVNNRGSIEPGSCTSVGQLTIDGNYFQTAEGSLRIKIRDGIADRLIVNEGGVCLNGKLCIDASGCLSDCDSFLILDNRLGSGISGSFSSVTANGIPSSLFMTLCQQPKTVFVELIASPASQLSARALSQMNLVNEHTLNLLDRLQAVRYRFKPIEPREEKSISSSENTLTFRASRIREDLVALGELPPVHAEADTFWQDRKPASIYIAPLGSWGENEGTECVEGFDFHSVGGLIGADYVWERAGLGALLGYESLHGDIDQSIGDFRIHSLFLQGYTTFLPLENHNWFFELIASGSYNWQHLNRDNDITAKPHSWEYDGYIGTGYNVALGQEWRVTPLVAMQYIHVDVDSFHEENHCGDALCFDDEKFHTWRSLAGLSFEGKLEKANITWMPELVGYWQYQFDTTHTLDVSTRNTCFTREVEVFTGDHNLGIVGARLRALFGNQRNWSLAGAYHYFWGKNLSMNALYLEVGKNF